MYSIYDLICSSCYSTVQTNITEGLWGVSVPCPQTYLHGQQLYAANGKSPCSPNLLVNGHNHSTNLHTQLHSTWQHNFGQMTLLLSLASSLGNTPWNGLHEPHNVHVYCSPQIVGAVTYLLDPHRGVASCPQHSITQCMN